MDENSHSQDQAAQETPASRRELLLNLRRAQVAFLQHLSTETSLDQSAICQRLIDHSLKPEAGRYDDPLYNAALKYGSKPLARKNGGGKWTKVVVYLDEIHFDGLGKLAAESNASASKTMRRLLSDCMEKSNTPSRPHRNKARSLSSLRTILKSIPYSRIAAVILAGVVLLAVFFTLREGKSIDVGPHWAANEANLILDHHTHTSYSDGRLSAPELVELAFESGCDALVISDHSDTGGTVSDEQMSELENLRGQYPDLLLFSGIELNMPSYGGREHAGLIADPLVEADTLQRLRDLAERNLRRARKGGASSRSDVELLQMIADYQALRNGMLLVYNHPSREDHHTEENIWDITKWNARWPVFAAIEGAPGHQNAKTIGSYKEPYFTEDRWDPVVADIGGAWDQLLSDGHQLWAALASSDYHNDKLDKAPCSFARTHLIAPEWSYRGVLMSLKAGTFWADHGRILDQLWFSVDVDGLEQPAYPGYIVNVGDRDSGAVVSLALDRGPGSEGQPLTVEIIGNCNSGDVEVLAQQELSAEDSTVTTLLPLAATGLDGVSCFLRARVRLVQDSAPDYMAYTNPVRLILN